MKKILFSVMLTALLVTLVGCGGSIGSEASHSHSESSIAITNSSSVQVTILLDGVSMGSLVQGASGYLNNVSNGSHSLQALRYGTNHIVDATNFNITQAGNYSWTITDPYY